MCGFLADQTLASDEYLTSHSIITLFLLFSDLSRVREQSVRAMVPSHTPTHTQANGKRDDPPQETNICVGFKMAFRLYFSDNSYSRK